MNNNVQININREIIMHILRCNFLSFLKKVKLSITKKLLFLNIYFFIMKFSYKKFYNNSKNNIKNKRLKKLIKIFKYKRFFNIVRNNINLIKNPGKKITTAHAFLYYFRILKEKFIKGLKINIKLNRIKTQNTLLLFGIRNKISILFLINEMKKHYNSLNFENKFKYLIYKKFFKKSIEMYKKSNKIEENFRLLRRYFYINNIKNVMKRLNIKFLKSLEKEKITYRKKKNFMIKYALKNIKKFTKIKKFIKDKKNEKFNLSKINFIRRVKHRIFSKTILKKNILILISNIKKKYNYKTFILFKRLYWLKLNKNEEKNQKFFKKLAILKFKNYYNNSNNKKNNWKFYQRKINKIIFKKHFDLFYNNLTFFKNYKDLNKKSMKFYKRIYNKKIYKYIKNYYIYKKRKQILSIKCQKMHENLYKKNSFNKWKIYMLYKINKRNEYKYIKDQRNKIITKSLIEKLVKIVTKSQINKEDYLSKQFINRSSRGVRTALIWFNKLKLRVMLKRKNKKINNIDNNNLIKTNFLNKNNNKIIENKNEKYVNNNINNKNNLTKELSDIKELRNKKRNKPIILNLDNI